MLDLPKQPVRFLVWTLLDQYLQSCKNTEVDSLLVSAIMGCIVTEIGGCKCPAMCSAIMVCMPVTDLSMSLPPVFLAYRKLNNAVLAPPTCRLPVGDGAKRTLVCSQLMRFRRFRTLHTFAHFTDLSRACRVLTLHLLSNSLDCRMH